MSSQSGKNTGFMCALFQKKEEKEEKEEKEAPLSQSSEKESEESLSEAVVQLALKKKQEWLKKKANLEKLLSKPRPGNFFQSRSNIPIMQRQLFGRRPSAEEASNLSKGFPISGKFPPMLTKAKTVHFAGFIDYISAGHGEIMSFLDWHTLSGQNVKFGRRKEQVAAIDRSMQAYESEGEWAEDNASCKFQHLMDMYEYVLDHRAKKPMSDRRKARESLAVALERVIRAKANEYRPFINKSSHEKLLKELLKKNDRFTREISSENAVRGTRLVLSGHGSWCKNDGMVTLPSHINLLFYTYHAEPLNDGFGGRVDSLNQYRSGENPGYMPPVEICPGGTKVPNYRFYHWGSLNIRPEGKLSVQKKLQAYEDPSKQGVLLSDIFRWEECNRHHPDVGMLPVDMHWSCCRSISPTLEEYAEKKWGKGFITSAKSVGLVFDSVEVFKKGLASLDPKIQAKLTAQMKKK